jgi:signal transduction histidine kinase/ActR/RegA family two-component response regulator
MTAELLQNELARVHECLEREQRGRQDAEAMNAQSAREWQRQLELLHIIADSVNRAPSVEGAVQMVLDEICAFTGWPVGHAYVVAPDGPAVLASASLWHLDDPSRFAAFRKITEATRVALHEGLPGRVLATGECAWTSNLAADDIDSRQAAGRAAGLRGAFAWPVIAGPDTVAVIEFYSAEPVNPDAASLAIIIQAGIHLGRIFERHRAAEERKKLEDQILRAHRLEAIGALTSGIAHDLNNILSPVMMCVQLLQDKLSDPEDREILRIVGGGAQRGAEMIKHLLAFDRGIGGKRVPVQAGSVLREMAMIMRETFPRDILVIESAPPELWMVVADATQLHQVLMNFCVNARDAMPAGGTLTLGARNVILRADAPQIHPEAKEGHYVALSVSDSGQGIPPEILGRVFDPFFTTKEVGSGTGLGLSMVVGIVRSHGGFVTVSSEPARGSVFNAFLPAAAGPDVAPPLAAIDPVALGRSELVLVVDDEAAVLELTRRMLERHNYRVVTAADGREALSVFMLRRNEVKLVLTDAIMPVMGGVALIRALRSLNPKLKIVATSGLDEEKKRTELAGLGVTEMLMKPCTQRELLGAIQRQFAAI